MDKRPGIINPVRMDLLTNVKILDEDAVPAPPGFSPGKYADKVFKMFGGEETEVILEAENTLVKKFIDRFGDSFSIRKASWHVVGKFLPIYHKKPFFVLKLPDCDVIVK